MGQGATYVHMSQLLLRCLHVRLGEAHCARLKRDSHVHMSLQIFQRWVGPERPVWQVTFVGSLCI